MANYKVIYRDENPKWQPGCPMRIEVVQVSRDTESQAAFLQIKTRNVSANTIDAIEISAHATAPDGTVETVEFSTLDANVAAGGEWIPKALRLSSSEIEQVTTFVTRSGDATSFEPAIALPGQELLPLSPEAQRARKAELKAAGLNPEKLQDRIYRNDDWWICSCGALNVGRETCHSCDAPLELLLRLEDGEWLEERDRELRYQAASDALAEGSITQMEQAHALFEGLGGYCDSAELAQKCAEGIESAKKRSKRSRIAASVIALVVAAATAFGTLVVIPARERAAEQAEQARVAAVKNGALEMARVGDSTIMGSYERDNNASNGPERIRWQVLAVEDGRVLLVSANILGSMPFNSDGAASWEDCDLHRFLVDKFYFVAFTEQERDLIDGEPFCLSRSEVERFFETEASRSAVHTPYASARLNGADGEGYWWLRDSYSQGKTDIIMMPDGQFGQATGGRSGAILRGNAGVRPAIWVKI